MKENLHVNLLLVDDRLIFAIKELVQLQNQVAFYIKQTIEEEKNKKKGARNEDKNKKKENYLYFCFVI